MVNGSVKLFRLFGIDVFLHWSWFLVAIFLIPRVGADRFSGTGNTPMIWGALLYLSLFAIVLIHEFGHALACVSVGGRVKHIVLWPLGGIAFVQPPQRPGAVLWSIVAGPLVNVILVPVTIIAYFLIRGEFMEPVPGNNLHLFVESLVYMNAMLLVFNMLPIYPLDGGQTLMAILWFVIGRAKALKAVSILGLVTAAGVITMSVIFFEPFILAMALFIGFQAWSGYRVAMQLAKMDPRLYDERIANRAEKDDVEQRITEDVDPWRR